MKRAKIAADKGKHNICFLCGDGRFYRSRFPDIDTLELHVNGSHKVLGHWLGLKFDAGYGNVKVGKAPVSNSMVTARVLVREANEWTHEYALATRFPLTRVLVLVLVTLYMCSNF